MLEGSDSGRAHSPHPALKEPRIEHLLDSRRHPAAQLLLGRSPSARIAERHETTVLGTQPKQPGEPRTEDQEHPEDQTDEQAHDRPT